MFETFQEFSDFVIKGGKFRFKDRVYSLIDNEFVTVSGLKLDAVDYSKCERACEFKTFGQFLAHLIGGGVVVHKTSRDEFRLIHGEFRKIKWSNDHILSITYSDYERLI